jgi:hypothetical protein
MEPWGARSDDHAVELVRLNVSLDLFLTGLGARVKGIMAQRDPLKTPSKFGYLVAPDRTADVLAAMAHIHAYAQVVAGRRNIISFPVISQFVSFLQNCLVGDRAVSGRSGSEGGMRLDYAVNARPTSSC